ncbi:MAG: ribose 5-phosphate isomerase B [Candidatus Kapabacteria bacterium]|nr:ribose 5-phosphate isomerase B [Ignavibacteriota bacterium]MCW5883836.1 ribose 5-phosphate isomerase B [Candidatus Kapabacteria bacterium]
MKIALASDHAGFELKEFIREYLTQKEYKILDFGAFSSESVDYPDYAFPASEAVSSGVADIGILICGTGTGMAITANKIHNIRAANCVTPEMAVMARSHNNANILTYGSRLISPELAVEITEKFISTEFEGGRHQKRIIKIHYLTGS